LNESFPMNAPPDVTPEPLAAGEFFARARARLTLDVPKALHDPGAEAVRGDLDLDSEMWLQAGVVALRPAAVLVGIVDRPVPTVLLTRRTPDLSSHAGQIAFPGGKIDPHDETPLAAAVREAHEEVGLDGKFIEPIGYLDLYLTFSGFRILPSVARIAPDYEMTLNRGEVDDAFEVPLEFLMAPGNHRRESRENRGVTRHYYAMPYEERYIWGVTAGIIRNLYERIYNK
jgi:8-oxo-dGTP pyrophosphatase MutT (NUDIX family)